MDIPQFLLGNIWSCDALRPIAREQKDLMDYNQNCSQTRITESRTDTPLSFSINGDFIHTKLYTSNTIDWNVIITTSSFQVTNQREHFPSHFCALPTNVHWILWIGMNEAGPNDQSKMFFHCISVVPLQCMCLSGCSWNHWTLSIIIVLHSQTKGRPDELALRKHW